ncbi:relaxase/mobilization nuclease domain-containing protein [Bradyrhizobium sp. CCGUVB14]|uniref:relaxase/mobilization nuclease domain-containing protein n=1 Tax=Bradyrhizobium sp. CCGUVB14 TaxID=2949628 RepID=UPI0020B26472|nr:relaxase/mobilization nuclease domain-containing protein [Bradyrhizobium sp. CCGUVB14]MCP3447322.1 relaxase/mobilization nuclease domain-containing protein [Bradyrhizobium sp. CCGUVB14]
MIIKGQARGRAKQLASHLLRADQNEAIQLVECRGTLAQDVEGALFEMEARGKAARSDRPLYHASISPEATTPLKGEQITQAVDHLEERLGLHGQPRVVVVHRKKDREHIHVVWSRIEAETGNAISYSWNYRLHEQASRELEAMFGHRPVPNSRARRARAPRGVEDYELRQQERSGRNPASVSKEVTAIWDASANPEELQARLAAAGYTLARGDRRVFVIIDSHGEVHSLARRIQGATVNDVRQKLKGLSLEALPSVREARAERPVAPALSLPAQFAEANREVSLQIVSRAPRIKRSPRTSVRSLVRVHTGSLYPDRRVRVLAVRVHGRRSRNYHSSWGAILAEFAARLAEARRSSRPEELAAVLATLHAEREATLAALRKRETGSGAKPRKVPPQQRRKRPKTGRRFIELRLKNDIPRR